MIRVCYNNGIIKLRPDEIVVIMGERGAGKTFLLNTIERTDCNIQVLDEPTAHDLYTESERLGIRQSIVTEHQLSLIHI